MLEIVVIGGGIAGFSVALSLWERGAAVTVVEATRPGSEATGASAGMLAAQYEVYEPDARFLLGLESRRTYPEFVDRLKELSGQDVRMRWDGMLVANLDRREREEAEHAAGWQSRFGLSAELLEPDRAMTLQSGISTDVESYLWLPEEGQVDAQRLASALGDALSRTGIRLIGGNRVTAVITDTGDVVGVRMVDGRTLEADRVVVAAGAWSDQLEGLPRRVPVRPVRGQMLRFPMAGLSLRRIVAGHTGSYIVPRADGTLLAGSTMEEVGFDRAITDEGLRGIHSGAARLIPALVGARPLEHWAGLRPISDDGLPIIGPDPDLSGLLYATGYGRDGILLAPLAGSLVAELALDGRSDLDWRPFRPDRFDPAR